MRLSQSMSIAFNPYARTSMGLSSREPSSSHRRITEHHVLPSLTHTMWQRINGKLCIANMPRTMQRQFKNVTTRDRGYLARVTWCDHASAIRRYALSSSASRLTVRSTLPSLSASVAFPFLPASLLLCSFRRYTLLLSKARGTEYAHVPGTIDELTATDTSSSSHPILPPFFFFFFFSSRLISNFEAFSFAILIQNQTSYLEILNSAHRRNFWRREGLSR